MLERYQNHYKKNARYSEAVDVENKAQFSSQFFPTVVFVTLLNFLFFVGLRNSNFSEPSNGLKLFRDFEEKTIKQQSPLFVYRQVFTLICVSFLNSLQNVNLFLASVLKRSGPVLARGIRRIWPHLCLNWPHPRILPLPICVLLH